MTKINALYYTIINGYHPFGFPIMKVTSENKKQIYGSVDGVSIHRRKEDARGKFKTIEEAETVRCQINEVMKRYSLEYSRLNQEMNKFHASEHAEIEDIINGHYLASVEN